MRALGSRLLSFEGREPRTDAVAAVMDPSCAQFHLWLAQHQRDHGNFSDREMAVMERVAGPLARRSRTMFNPFTGEIRKVEI